jgi:DNA-binding response OmpR family regulator
MSDRFDDGRFPGGLTTGVSAPLHLARLLLVDGEDGTRFRVASDFKQAGASVDFAHCGSDAVSCVIEAQDAQEPYDLVVLDLSGLGRDGCGVARQLRGSLYAGPILALSDKTSRAEGSRCIQAGCDDLLTKSDNPSELIAAVASLVGRERARRYVLAGPDEVTSELSAYPELLMMLRRFVTNLPASVESVLSAQREQDLARLREELDLIKRNATSHGYLSIRASAVTAQQELDHSRKPDTQGVVDAIDELADLCRRATASPSNPPPPAGPPLPPSG